ncbi:MAG: MFS transporter [Ferruginibacter sp.]|nr:MFS transporter [Cytophagales bacterium]
MSPVPSLRESRPLRYFTFFYLYLMQGIPAGFALTAVANYLTAEKLSAQAVGTFVAVVGLPWAAQFVWGPLIDRFQRSAIGDRKHWVLLAQFMAFVASLGVLLVDDPLQQIPLLSLAFFVHSIFASVQDASVDALAISIIPTPERGRANAFMRGGMLMGISLGAAGLSYLINRNGFFYAALTQSLTLLALTVLTFFIKEKRGDAWFPWQTRRPSPPDREDGPPVSLRWLFTELYRGMADRRNLLTFGAIALVYFCNSVFLRTFSFHLITKLRWTDTSVSMLQGTWGSGIVMIVILSGGVLSDRMGARRLQNLVMLGLGGFLITFGLLAPYWSQLPFATAGLVFSSLADPSFSVAAMPVLMALCRKGVEGSQFTTYMALVNLCDLAGAYVSGHALAWISAPVLVFFCGMVVTATTLLVALRFRERGSVRFSWLNK